MIFRLRYLYSEFPGNVFSWKNHISCGHYKKEEEQSQNKTLFLEKLSLVLTESGLSLTRPDVIMSITQFLAEAANWHSQSNISLYLAWKCVQYGAGAF